MKVEDLNRAIDTFAPSEAQKEKMLNHILRHGAKQRGSKRTVWKISAITAALFLFAAAAVAMNNTVLFKEIFGDRVDLVKEQILSPISFSQNEHFKLALEGVLSDPHNSMAVVSAEALSERGLQALRQKEWEMTVQTVQANIQASTGGTEELENLSTKRKKYIAVHFMSLDGMLTGDIQIQFSAAETNLTVTAPTESTIETVNVTVDERHYEHADYVPQRITISPLSVTVAGVERNVNYHIPNPQVIIRLANGEEIDVFRQETGFGGSRFVEEGVTAVSALLERMIDLRKVEAVIVDGQEYRIE